MSAPADLTLPGLLSALIAFVRRAFARLIRGKCGLKLRCVVTEEGAALLDTKALLGLGYDRERLFNQRLAQCFVRNGKCHCFPGAESCWERPVVGLGPDVDINRRLKWAPPGQEHLFDRDGYAPGGYELDREAQRTIIMLLRKQFDAELRTPKQGRLPRSEDAASSSEQRSTQGHELDPSGHRCVQPADGSSVPVHDETSTGSEDAR